MPFLKTGSNMHLMVALDRLVFVMIEKINSVNSKICGSLLSRVTSDPQSTSLNESQACPQPSSQACELSILLLHHDPALSFVMKDITYISCILCPIDPWLRQGWDSEQERPGLMFLHFLVLWMSPGPQSHHNEGSFSRSLIHQLDQCSKEWRCDNKSLSTFLFTLFSSDGCSGIKTSLFILQNEKDRQAVLKDLTSSRKFSVSCVPTFQTHSSCWKKDTEDTEHWVIDRRTSDRSWLQCHG